MVKCKLMSKKEVAKYLKESRKKTAKVILRGVLVILWLAAIAYCFAKGIMY